MPASREAYEARTKEVRAAWDEANRIQNAKAEALSQICSERKRPDGTVEESLPDLPAGRVHLPGDGPHVDGAGRTESHFERVSSRWWRSYYGICPGEDGGAGQGGPDRDVWNTPVDVSDMPRFVFEEESLGDRIRAVAKPFAVLAIGVLFLFAAAYISMIRYDPR